MIIAKQETFERQDSGYNYSFIENGARGIYSKSV